MALFVMSKSRFNKARRQPLLAMLKSCVDIGKEGAALFVISKVG